MIEFDKDEAEVRPKWTPKPYGGKKKYYPSKSSEISKAVDRKEASIASYTDKKEAGIVISGAIRDAVLWCVNHPRWGDDALTDIERREWIDKITKENIKFVASSRSDLESYYNQLRSASDEIARKAREETDISAIETIDDPDPDSDLGIDTPLYPEPEKLEGQISFDE